jgi:hypothetical protein
MVENPSPWMIQKENKVMNTDKEMVDLPPFPA